MNKLAFMVVALLGMLAALPLAAQTPVSVRVTAEYQAWADGNHDGMLQPDEAEGLMRTVMRFFGEPHPADNDFDGFLDVNHDGKIVPRRSNGHGASSSFPGCSGSSRES